MARGVAKKVDTGNWKWYFYDGLKVIAEGTATNSRTYYTNSPAAIGGIITDGGGWYHYDRLGNVVATTGSDGAPTGMCTMDAFGNVLQTGDSYSGYLADSAGTGGGYHLTTKEFDSDSGLYYFNARWYDPTTGRFVSGDRVFPSPNRYAYCSDNPLKYTDSTGLLRQAGDAVISVNVSSLSAGAILVWVNRCSGFAVSSCPCQAEKGLCYFSSIGAGFGASTPIDYINFNMECYIPGQKCLDADAIGGGFLDIAVHAVLGGGAIGGVALGGGMQCELISIAFGLGAGVTVAGYSNTKTYGCSSTGGVSGHPH